MATVGIKGLNLPVHSSSHLFPHILCTSPVDGLQMWTCVCSLECYTIVDIRLEFCHVGDYVPVSRSEHTKPPGIPSTSDSLYEGN